MKAERFRQIRNLFDATLEHDTETRNAFLQEACQGDEELLVEVGRLLAAQGEPTAWIDESVLGPPLPRLEGRNVGSYEVLRQVGEGGMGAVYLAARTDRTARELVALKIVRPEMANEEVLRRFKREREILESLDHPNIARVFDGGVTSDGLPYLVMEYVDGQPIDAYCDEHRLDPGARLKLFRDVCAAVQYAHEHRVVHRDLKPSNILVTARGVVKLLDFGISKLAASGSDTPTLTRTDLLLMTPEYASPEQVTGLAATPASDVYALGVVLYELLTGRRPYRLRSRILREIVRVICDELPARPSAAVTRKDVDEGAPTPDTVSRARALSSTELRRQLVGDLDYILLKALEKDPIQRYRSAQQFSEDLGLHLSGRMVEARRYAALKRAGRLALQNRWWLIAASAVSLAVSSGLIEIPRWVLLEVAVMTVALGFAYFVLRNAFGKNQAHRTTAEIARNVSVTCVAMAAWLLMVPPPWVGVPFILLLPLMCVLPWFLLIRWRSRADRLGPLVLDLSRGANSRLRIITPIALIAVTLSLLAVAVSRAPRVSASGAIFFFLVGLFWISISVGVAVLTERVEIRQKGLALAGRLIPWSTVLSYSWEQDSGEFELLRLRYRGVVGLAIAPLLRMHSTDRPLVNSILEQQLYEWPS